jgi:hypothetical protein
VADLAEAVLAAPVAAVTEEPDTAEEITPEASQGAAAARDGDTRLDTEALADLDSLQQAAHPVVSLEHSWPARSAPSMAPKPRSHNPVGTLSADQAEAVEHPSIPMQEVSG